MNYGLAILGVGFLCKNHHNYKLASYNITRHAWTIDYTVTQNNPGNQVCTATFHNGHVYNCTSVVAIIKYGAPNKKMNAPVACYQNPLLLEKWGITDRSLVLRRCFEKLWNEAMQGVCIYMPGRPKSLKNFPSSWLRKLRVVCAFMSGKYLNQ